MTMLERVRRVLGITEVGREKSAPWLEVVLVMVLVAALSLGHARSASATSKIDAPLSAETLLGQAHDPSTAKTALVELLARLKTNQLSPAQIADVVHDALAIQADTAKPWLTQWGDLVDQAHAMGLISRQDWQTYGRHALYSMTLRLRPRMRAAIRFRSWSKGGRHG